MNENNFIEVDGIRFETLVPKRVLTLPKKNLIQKLSDLGKHLLKPPLHPSPGYPVEIGIRITNNSDRPLYFSFYFALFPEIIKAKDGTRVPFNIGWFRPVEPLKSDFLLALPGESINFFLDIKICWLCGKNYGFSASFGGTRLLIEPLHSERYKIRLVYTNQKNTEQFYDFINKKNKIIEGLWTGRVLTQFVEICLVNS
ncbi:hypothetical protein [Roseofilum capinflatum]|uniref:Uncharacterized protein n=1 Tax=Roseofilum capinflatum BLCC-M114 TaxID=3022440 RepID=A0ABT7B0A2_9CYAN|nr:hypothetical protein [Roseofilum capinflatum]MDJ1172550.1 hypothetical protein [Roseofilum capinflatum BLCC-M114]